MGIVAGLVAGVALAVNGQFFGQTIEARPYAIVLLLTACATLVLVIIREDGRALWWLYAVFVALAVVLQIFSILMLLAHLALVRRTMVRAWLISSAAPVVVAVAVVAAAHSQSGQLDWLQTPSLHDAVNSFIAQTGESAHAILLLVAILVVAATFFRSREVDRVWLMALILLIAPTVVLFVVSHAIRPVLLDRYVVSLQIGAALLLGAGAEMVFRLVSIRLAGSAPTIAALVVAALAIVAVGVVSEPNLRQSARPTSRVSDNFQALAAALNDKMKPGEELLVQQDYDSEGYSAGVAYYLHDAAFTRAIETRLIHGQIGIIARTVEATNPIRTTEPDGTATSIWVVQPPGDVATPPTQTASCTAGQPLTVDGDLILTHFTCP